MDLEAANLSNSRTGFMTRVVMVACFVLTGFILITSLAVAKSSTPTPNSANASTIPH